jgi:hypothetical protein
MDKRGNGGKVNGKGNRSIETEFFTPENPLNFPGVQKLGFWSAPERLLLSFLPSPK